MKNCELQNADFFITKLKSSNQISIVTKVYSDNIRNYKIGCLGNEYTKTNVIPIKSFFKNIVDIKI